MSGELDLSVSVPLFNEEACTERCITDLLDSLDASGFSYELISINNGSRDRTGEILDKLAAARPTLKPMHLPKNLGYGGGLLEGFNASRGAILGFTCGDGEVSSADLVRIAKVLRSGGLDLVKAKRIGRVDGFLRKCISLGYSMVIGLIANLHVTDINGYPLLFTREAYGKLKIKSTDWLINFEILLRARMCKLRTAEIDVPHLKRVAGRSHVRIWFPLLWLYQLTRFKLSYRMPR